MFMFIFVYLVNVCSILKCKNCVYLCIVDTIQIQLSLWHSYTYVHMYVCMYVCVCVYICMYVCVHVCRFLYIQCAIIRLLYKLKTQLTHQT